MHGLTDYITACPWTDVFTVWFVLVDDAYAATYGQQRLRHRGPAPRLTDSEVITLSLIGDTYFHGNEELMLSFVQQHYRALFPQLLSQGRFNRRRRALSAVIEGIRQVLTVQLLDPSDAVRLIDSAPIPVCTYQRSLRCTTVQGSAYCSVMPSRRAKLFGFHLDLTTSLDQVLDQWMRAPAAPHDSKMAEALLEDQAGLCVIGDTAFYDPTVRQRLAVNRQIQLVAPPQRKQKHGQWPSAPRRFINRLRRRIESALSVLVVVFNLEHPGARSLSGLVTRIATRLLGYTISFLTTAILLPTKN